MLVIVRLGRDLIGQQPLEEAKLLGELGVGVVVALFLPVAAAFLDEPEAHDVFEEADGAGDAALVGVVVFEGFVIDDGVVGFDAHEGPGAG